MMQEAISKKFKLEVYIIEQDDRHLYGLVNLKLLR